MDKDKEFDKEKDKQERKYLSDKYVPAPHVERDKTIISTFLDPGERAKVEQREAEEDAEDKKPKFNQYKKPKTWMDYWEQREEIYRKKDKLKTELYDPTAQEKLVAVLGYFAFFIPIFTKHSQKSAFVKFHMKQSMNLLMANMFVFIAFGVGVLFLHVYFSGPPFAEHIFDYHRYMANHEYIPANNDIFFLAISSVWLFPIYLIGAGISNASNGRWKQIPLIGKDILDD